MSQPQAVVVDPAILDERDTTLSPAELELLLDEDESKLEEREAALTSIRDHVARQASRVVTERCELERLHIRYDAIERNVKVLRRRRERINFRFPDGTRIFDLEVVS